MMGKEGGSYIVLEVVDWIHLAQNMDCCGHGDEL
jgi:hypothetical protein